MSRVEVPTTQLWLRPELAGRWSPVGDGGERGGGSSSSLKRSWRVIGWPQSTRPLVPCRGLEGGRWSGVAPP